LDRGEKRPITIFFANKTPADAVYRDLLDRAERELAIKTVYTFTDPKVVLPPGSVSRLDPEILMREVPDFQERKYYLSGPQGMVHAFQDMLASMGIRRDAITTDYFPGFA
jgi:ferredoxin-NADP reductase